MSDAPLSPLAAVDLMPELLASANAVLHENSLEAQGIATSNNSQDAADELNGIRSDGLRELAVSTFPPLLPRLQLKLPVLSSSSSDSDGDDVSRPTVGGASLECNADRTTSPPPNCAICLSRCKNKCFTDSCMHQFCFKCLCEWSKVKPECPLCKQTFKSIIHNVKSMDQFEEYHVQAPTVHIPNARYNLELEMLSYGNRYVLVTQRNRNSMVLAPEPSGSRGTGGGQNPFDSRAARAYPITMLDGYYRRHPDSIGDEGISHLWRTYIYDLKLYALPVCDVTGRFRDSNARFYRENPAQVHRLMPWIRRDVDCLVDGALVQRDDVLESIAEALTMMNILSPAFRRRVQPYLGTKTGHFIHELNNFARSPYDMFGYDRTVRYSPQIREEIVIEFSLSESTDTEDNPNENGNAHAASTSTGNFDPQALNAINLSIHDRVNSNTIRGVDGAVIELGDDSDNNNDPAASTSRQEPLQQNQPLPLQQQQQQQLQGPSNGASVNESMIRGSLPSITDNIELSSTSSECEFVLERKPPHLRTPEMVSLDSASDSDVVFVEETKPLRKTTFNTTDEEDAMQQDGDVRAVGGGGGVGIGLDGDGCGNADTLPTSHRNKLNMLKDGRKSEQPEMFNVGASTSSGLRSTMSMRKRDGLVQSQPRSVRHNLQRFQRWIRRDTSTTTTTSAERVSRGKRLNRFSSPSATSTSTTSSSSSTTSLTTTSSSSSTTDLSSSSSDEDFQPPFIRKRQNSRENSNSSCYNNNNNNSNNKPRSVSKQRIRSNQRTTRKRRMIKRKSKRSGDGGSKRSKTNETSTDDSEDKGDASVRGAGKNFALVMAMADKLKKQEQKSHRKRQWPISVEQQDVENSWRTEAVDEPLKKQQRQQARNARKRPHKLQQEQQQQQEQLQEHQQQHQFETNNAQTTNIQNTVQQKQQQQQCLPHVSEGQAENSIKREYLSDDEDIDNLNLSILKSILKGERPNSLKRERPSGGADEGMPLQSLFHVNERDESNSMHTAAGEVEIPRPGINNELLLNIQTTEAANLGRLSPPLNETASATSATTTVTATTSNNINNNNNNNNGHHDNNTNNKTAADLNKSSSTSFCSTPSSTYSTSADEGDNNEIAKCQVSPLPPITNEYLSYHGADCADNNSNSSTVSSGSSSFTSTDSGSDSTTVENANYDTA